MRTDEQTLDLTKFRRLFLSEAADLAAEIESGLLLLADEPLNQELLHSVFRAAHSIKGNAGMTGYETAAEFVHTLETILEKLRNGERELTEELTTKLLEATDCLREILAEDPRAPLRPHALAIQQDLQSRWGQASPSTQPDLPPETAPAAQRFRIAWKPPADSMMRGVDPAKVLRSICDNARVIEASCDAASVPPLDELQFEQSHLAFELVVETEATRSALVETFSLLALDAQLQIEQMPAEREPPALPPGAVHQPAPKAVEATVRLSCSKLDALFDLVGEVVIAQSMILQTLRSPARVEPDADALHRILEDLERNTQELQDRMMSLRLVPLEQVFNRIPRLVRDLTTQLNKRIHLEISGADTEIDRVLVDKLADPLMHLVRNCVDHGIESPEERVRAGKPPKGSIRLHAFHEAGRTVIEISDDGRGLDTEKIRTKALQSGFIKSPDELHDHQLHLLIFHPGLSTADRITGVSGRGVGMDAVRVAFESMAGTVQVITERGKGTTFRMRIPITMAILDALLLRQAGSILAIPVANILECVRLRPDRIRVVPSENGAFREVFLSRDSVLPVIRLSQLLQRGKDLIANTDSLRNRLIKMEDNPQMAVLIEHDGRHYSLLADDIAGQQQVLVKSLDTNYRRIEGLQGASILPDGTVALVLDIGGMIRLFDSASSRREPAYQ